MKAIILMGFALTAAGLEIDLTKPDETIFKVQSASEFGVSDIPGFFYVRLDARPGFSMDGYVAQKDGHIYHNHKIDSVTSVVRMEGVTMLAIPKAKTMLKIYIPESVHGYDALVSALWPKRNSAQQGDAPEPATNASPASRQPSAPAR